MSTVNIIFLWIFRNARRKTPPWEVNCLFLLLFTTTAGVKCLHVVREKITRNRHRSVDPKTNSGTKLCHKASMINPDNKPIVTRTGGYFSLHRKKYERQMIVMLEEVSPSPSVFVSLCSSRFFSFSRARDRTSEQASGPANQITNFNFQHGLVLIDVLSANQNADFFFFTYIIDMKNESSLSFSISNTIWHVFVFRFCLRRTASKCVQIYNTPHFTSSLLCSLNPVFGDVFIGAVIAPCYKVKSSLAIMQFS